MSCVTDKIMLDGHKACSTFLALSVRSVRSLQRWHNAPAHRVGIDSFVHGRNDCPEDETPGHEQNVTRMWGYTPEPWAVQCDAGRLRISHSNVIVVSRTVTRMSSRMIGNNTERTPLRDEKKRVEQSN